MKFFVSFLFAIISITVAAEPNRCEIYLQIEEQAKCTQRKKDHSHYLTDFGYAYCHQFTQAAESWDPELQLFIKSVAKCLQEDVIANFAKGYSCKKVENDAFFKAHPRCYYQTGFCQLSFEQKFQVINEATSFGLIFKPKVSILLTSKLFYSLYKNCNSRSPDVYTNSKNH